MYVRRENVKKLDGRAEAEWKELSEEVQAASGELSPDFKYYYKMLCISFGVSYVKRIWVYNASYKTAR